jgi:broad specificity phosphatase PhoE
MDAPRTPSRAMDLPRASSRAMDPPRASSRLVPGEDADAAGLTRAKTLAGRVAGAPAYAAPARAALRTAAAMGLEAAVAEDLAEADYGRWSGLPYERVARDDPDGLASWLTDPHATPHGGESLAALAARVAGWLDEGPPPEAVVVCDAGVIRAALGHALGLDPTVTARFDLAPLSTTELSATRSGWRVSHVNRKVTP